MSNYWSIPELPNMTAQEVFDKSVKHVLKNGKPSRREKDCGSACVYSGLGCAAAPFLLPEHRQIADEQASKIGGSGWYNLRNNSLVDPAHCYLIGELQQCHDKANTMYFVEDFKRNARLVCARHGLNYPTNE